MNNDNFLWILTAGALSLFVTGCVFYGYHRVVNALNDPTAIIHAVDDHEKLP